MSGYWETPINGFLRDPPRNLARSAYAVEVNPWARRGDVEAALLFRGAIVSGFGYIDTRLSEFAIRTSLMPEYIGMRSNLPFFFDKRVKYLRDVFEKEPLNRFEKLANQFLDRLESHQDLRNLAAHAQMQVAPDWGVTLNDFRPQKKSEVSARTMRMTPSDFEKAAWKIARLSRLCQHLLNDLEQEIDLPSTSDAE